MFCNVNHVFQPIKRVCLLIDRVQKMPCKLTSGDSTTLSLCLFTVANKQGICLNARNGHFRDPNFQKFLGSMFSDPPRNLHLWHLYKHIWPAFGVFTLGVYAKVTRKLWNPNKSKASNVVNSSVNNFYWMKSLWKIMRSFNLRLQTTKVILSYKAFNDSVKHT